MRKLKRIFALLLAFSMIFNIASAGAYAEETESLANDGFYKIVHLDAARKYFSAENIKSVIDTASAAGFNQLELYLADNQGFRLQLENMTVTTEYGTYDLTPALGAGYDDENLGHYTDGSDNRLSQSEMDEIIAYARLKGMSVVPCVNAPGHMGAILEAFPQFCFSTEIDGTTVVSKSALNLWNEEAYAFGLAVIEKYAAYFASRGVRYFNFGADEYGSDLMTDHSTGENNGMDIIYNDGRYGEFVSFVNEAAAVVEAKGMTPRAFNDGIYYNNSDTYNGQNISFDTDIQICYWYNGWSWSDYFQRADASYLAEKGFSMINANGDYYYILTADKKSECSPEQASQFNYQLFRENDTLTDVAGAMFCIWCDNASETLYTSDQVVENVAATITAFGGALNKEELNPKKATVTQDDGITATAPGLLDFSIVQVEDTTGVPTIEGAENSNVYEVVAAETLHGSYSGDIDLSIPIPKGWNAATVNAVVLEKNVSETAGTEVNYTQTTLEGIVADGSYQFTYDYNVAADEFIVLYDTGFTEVPVAVRVNETASIEVEGLDLTLEGPYQTEDSSIATVTVSGDTLEIVKSPGEKITSGTLETGEYYFYDGSQYLNIDEWGTWKLTDETDARPWEVTANGDGTYTFKQGDYYLINATNEYGFYLATALTGEAQYSWQFDENGIYVTLWNDAYYVYWNSGGWLGAALISEITPFAAYNVATSGGTSASKITFYGRQEGTTEVVIGDTKYVITVEPEQERTEELILTLGSTSDVYHQIVNVEDEYSDSIVDVEVAYRRQDSVTLINEADISAGKSFYITDGEGNYLVVDQNGNLVNTTEPSEEEKWTLLENGTGYSLRFGDYYLINRYEMGQIYISAEKAVSDDSDYVWSHGISRGIFCTDNINSYRLAYDKTANQWIVDETTVASTRFCDLEINEGVYASDITFTGTQVGETRITIGKTTYIITVTEAPSEATQLTVEYWITNNRSGDPENGNAIELTIESNTVNEAGESIATEKGITLESLAAELTHRRTSTEDAETPVFDTGAELVFWKGVVHKLEAKQELNRVSRTLTGTNFTYIRYWNGKWSCSNNGLSWVEIESTDQIIAYYIQKTDATQEIITYAMDWGIADGCNADEGDTNPGYDCYEWGAYYSYVMLDFAVKYESGTRIPEEGNPDPFPLAKSIAFHCDHNDTAGAVHQDENDLYYRTLGVIQAQNTPEYEVYMITVTPTSDVPTEVISPIPTDEDEVNGTITDDHMPIGKTYDYLGTEKVIWIDDEEHLGTFADPELHAAGYRVGGVPIVASLDIYEHQGMLVTYYIRAVSTVEEETVTVHYHDVTMPLAPVEFYNYSIIVKENTVFDEGIALDDPWKGNLLYGTIENIKGETETVSADLFKMPNIDPKYRYGQYTCIRVERSADGKEVHLYYTFDDASYVVDFGLKVKVPLTDFVSATSAQVEVLFEGEYGTAIIDGEYLVYEPTEVLRGIDMVTLQVTPADASAFEVNCRFYPATTVYYEEDFIEYGNDSAWESSGTAISDAQTATQLGEESIHYGYDAVYAAQSTGASNGTEIVSNDTVGYAEFAFTGTGVDIYANCDTNTGSVNILVKNEDTGRIVKFIVVDTVARGKGSATQGQDVESYHLPIASVSVEHGSYTVQIRHCKSAASDTKPVRLDGFRVYNTLKDSRVFHVDQESEPNFLEMRNVVLNALNLQEAVKELGSDYVTAEELAAVIKQVINVEENGAGVTALIFDENKTYTNEYVQDLLDNGPKNEVFLFKDQSLVFTLSPGLKNVQIGLKAVDGEVTYKLNGGEATTLKSSTDMFYELCGTDTLTEARTITITNTSDSILSVTDLKWFIGSDADPTEALMTLEESDIEDALEDMGYASEEVQGVIRISGAEKIDTALTVADVYKEKLGIEKFEAVVIASDATFADALPGSYLAYVNDAPLLLISEKRMDAVVSYVKDNLTEDGKVYILGGKAAIPLTLEGKLDGYDVQRLAGKNRYETNIRILEAAEVAGKELIVATGRTFADSLSASAVKRPILLVNDQLSPAQKAYLETLNVEKFYIVGGESAVGTAVEAELEVYGATERIAGANRRETSVLVADKFFENPDTAVVASAVNFPDGLCGGPLAAVINAPMILTADDWTEEAAGYVQGKEIWSGYVLGGAAALEDESVVSIFGLMDPEEIIVQK